MWPWQEAKKECFALLDHYGSPGEDEPELRNQAALERKILEFFDPKNEGKHPAASDIREHVVSWLDEWVKIKKAGK